MSYQEQTTQNQTVDDDRQENLATHDLLDTAATNGNFSRFLAAESAAGIQSILRGPDLFTVFASLNEAFDADAGVAKIAHSVRGHIVAGALTAADLKTEARLSTIEGTTIAVGARDGSVRVGDDTIIRPDVECINGVPHGIDRVLGV